VIEIDKRELIIQSILRLITTLPESKAYGFLALPTVVHSFQVANESVGSYTKK